jgi:hypothetical protein
MKMDSGASIDTVIESFRLCESWKLLKRTGLRPS